MSSAASALLAAVKARLAADATLEALLGGPGRIHDGPPRNAPFPHVAFETIESRPVGGLDAPLEEHRLTLTAWSRAGGRREALALADRLDGLLDAAGPALTGHRLVSLALERREARLARDRLTAVATLVFRAATEPA
jgi:hypothetical protein